MLRHIPLIVTYFRGSIIGGRTFRKPPYFVPSKSQTAFIFFLKPTPFFGAAPSLYNKSTLVFNYIDIRHIVRHRVLS